MRCKMLYVREPTDDEYQELHRMTRQEIGRVSQRAQMVLLSARGHTVPDIGRLFETSRVTVRFWLRRFDVAGPAGLYDDPRTGRPRQIGPEVAATVVELVEDDPRQAGYLASVWTVAMLRLVLVCQYGWELGLSSVRRLLHDLGLRWRRPRLTMPDKLDPNKAAKQWAIAQAVIEAPANAAIVYADASRVQLLPLVRAMWQWVGQQVRIPTPGNNDSRTLLGALNIDTGRWDYLVRLHARTEDFLAFLEHLLTCYPEGPLLVIVDNFSSHTAHAVQDWLAAHPRLHLFYLPTYCSQLNPVEAIWLRLKDYIAANRLYASMPFLLDTVALFFRLMSPELALQWSAA